MPCIAIPDICVPCMFIPGVIEAAGDGVLGAGVTLGIGTGAGRGDVFTGAGVDIGIPGMGPIVGCAAATADVHRKIEIPMTMG